MTTGATNPDRGVSGSRPPLFLLVSEVRAVAELTATLMTMPALLQAPRGDGHPVLVIPGFLAGDLSTLPLRRYLATLGYNVHPWRLGRNTGGVGKMVSAVQLQIAEIRRATNRKVSVIGWSLGGVYARLAALANPDDVRCVITLGSPFARARGGSTNLSEIYKQVAGESAATATPSDLEALAGDLPVPTTAIYSKSDGIVNWKSSALIPNHQSENIEILLGSHIGLGVNPSVLWAIADRLALREGEFKPFDRTGPFRLSYPLQGRDGQTDTP
ncbi:alpha/beta hydrolase [Bradyrhizobium manausense]|uniref:esterase/lipase family protein n=1 Tax=Bradyrhizobium TaxID=374 RepID=UPI001BA6B1FB|nr:MULTISPECIES: alpha/beta hydrolase [Bradyrhizobium]MBR0825669.1 alpha/beta hydrolase [Bradyrhizobium manausense]UVO31379.1 alpha/beta hydrolase [Bradyrhizobium arachidis]